jgi:glutathione peroxidase
MRPRPTMLGAKTAVTIHDFSARLGTGEEHRLADYRGKVLLIVNVASKCGFTPQYNGLQSLYEQFRPRGFEILAFPCDQFGHQEPGSRRKNAHPLYVWLRQQKGGLLGNSIKWNFTKFLVDKAGVVRARFAPMTKPERLVREVAGLL